MSDIALQMPDALLEQIAHRAADIMAERDSGPEPWVGVAEAAAHLGCGKDRIYALSSAGRIPHEKDGSRLLFRRSALDAWLAKGGGKRP